MSQVWKFPSLTGHRPPLMNLQQLRQTFLNLRKRWPQNWPGFDRVVQSALHQLGHSANEPLAPRLQAMHACILEVAMQVEQVGQAQALQGREPDYHNRLHISDTLVALTALLLQQRAVDQRAAQGPLSPQEWQMVLAICSHDLLHTGGINRYTSELEAQSLAALTPLMQRHGVMDEDQAAIGYMILQTDPSLVKASHQQVRQAPFDLTRLSCQTVLIQEADILASALPQIGEALTRQLSQEWSKIDPQRAQSLLSVQARLFFLREMALFSSPASQRLGIQALIDRHTASLVKSG